MVLLWAKFVSSMVTCDVIHVRDITKIVLLWFGIMMSLLVEYLVLSWGYSLQTCNYTYSKLAYKPHVTSI